MIGRRLAHYEILRELGRGGMGQVYVARDDRLDREVALKVLSGELADDPDRLARFEREAKTLASLNHPNIVTIYSVEEADGIRFMTMELVRGSTLDAHVPTEGMELRDFLALAEPLADAVAAAHEQGIHHRDLKPANVMVTDDGRVKVLDFGLAKLQRQAASSDGATEMLTGEFTGDRTAEGQIVGTISYMSPEQAQGTPVDHRSDIFSLGILLYEMITGKRPFEGPNNISVLSAILKDEPRSISDVRQSDVPVPLARIIQRALAKRPDQRYQSARDMKQDLGDLRADLAAGELLGSGLHSGVHAAETTETNRLLRAGLLLAGLIVAGAAAMWLVFYGLQAGSIAGGGVATASSRADVPSVAVLPFENLTGSAELEWLAQGLPEMLVTDLSQAQNLRVVGNDRIHTIMDRGGMADETRMAAADVQMIAEEAGVALIVVGSFVQAGDQIRIDARVQDGPTSEVLASERVSGTADRIFDIVDDLSGRIRERVGMQGMSDEMMEDMSAAGMGDRALADVTTESVEAYRLYVDAVSRMHASRPTEAAPLFERAVELDPDFGMAWAKLSVAYGNSGRQDEAQAAATRAFELSESMPLEEQLYVRGRYYSLDEATLDQAETAYARAAELFPNNTAVRNNLGLIYMRTGRVELAVPLLEEAVALGTQFSGAYSNLAQAYATADRMPDAIRVLEDYVDANPGNSSLRNSLAEYLSYDGRLDEALEEARTAAGIDPVPNHVGTVAALLALRQDWAGVEEQLSSLEGSTDSQARLVSVHIRGSLAQLRGRIEEAHAIYDRGIEALADAPFARSQLLMSKVDIPLSLQQPEQIDAVIDRMAAMGLPGVGEQNIPFFRMLAAAIRGDGAAVNRQADELRTMLEGVPLSPRLRTQVDAQIGGIEAWAQGDIDDAIEQLTVAYESMPIRVGSSESIGMGSLVGELLWQQGRRDEAALWFERIDGSAIMKVQSPIASVRAEWYLGQLAEERGDTAEALRRYRRFLGFWENGEVDRERVAQARQYVETNG